MPTFVQLRTRVESYLIDVPQATSALVGAWINQAIHEAEEAHNFKHMQAIFESQTQSALGLPTLADPLPPRWKEPRDEAPYGVRDDGSTVEMAWAVNAQDMRRQFAVDDPDDDGAPQYLYLGNDEAGRFAAGADFLVHPWPDGESDWPDGEYRIRVPYWRYTAPLEDNNDTNWWAENAEWYLTFQASAYGLLFNRDTEEAERQLALAGMRLRKLINANKSAQRRGPRTLTPRPAVNGLGRQPPRKW